MRKRMLCGTLATALVMTAAGCAADPLAQDRLPEKKEETPVQRSETYPELWQEDGSLFDDFTNGVNPEIWTVPDTKWGYDNRGVTSRNVSYTKDGILVLAANGDLYKGDIMGMSDGGQPGHHRHAHRRHRAQPLLFRPRQLRGENEGDAPVRWVQRHLDLFQRWEPEP